MKLQILYRGPLASCNYGCAYCPFAKQKSSRQELRQDREALERFVAWVEARPADDRIGVLITPWGEALIRRWYREGLERLTALPQVTRAAIQTNLTAPVGFVERCDLAKLALWCTWHPEWEAMEPFVRRVTDLHRRGVRLSVGVVGFARFAPQIHALRAALPEAIYVWINAVKDELPTLDPEIRAGFSQVDPLYELNTRRWPSLGLACRAGAEVISVDGDGLARRCHFIPTPLGNIYQPGWEQALGPQPCSNATCHCHIGYVHLEPLALREVFGAGLLERVPEGDWRRWRDPDLWPAATRAALGATTPEARP